jgi:RNA polymerase sigma factor (sigma-70 family)
MSDLSDNELLALFRKEDTRHYAFNLLVRQYQRLLYRFIRRMVTDHDEAQDVLQNTFIKAWNGLDGFRSDAKLSSWLYRIAHNECLNHLRSLQTRVVREPRKCGTSSPRRWTARALLRG